MSCGGLAYRQAVCRTGGLIGTSRRLRAGGVAGDGALHGLRLSSRGRPIGNKAVFLGSLPLHRKTVDDGWSLPPIIQSIPGPEGSVRG